MKHLVLLILLVIACFAKEAALEPETADQALLVKRHFLPRYHHGYHPHHYHPYHHYRHGHRFLARSDEDTDDSKELVKRQWGHHYGWGRRFWHPHHYYGGYGPYHYYGSYDPYYYYGPRWGYYHSFWPRDNVIEAESSKNLKKANSLEKNEHSRVKAVSSMPTRNDGFPGEDDGFAGGRSRRRRSMEEHHRQRRLSENESRRREHEDFDNDRGGFEGGMMMPRGRRMRPRPMRLAA